MEDVPRTDAPPKKVRRVESYDSAEVKFLITQPVANGDPRREVLSCDKKWFASIATTHHGTVCSLVLNTCGAPRLLDGGSLVSSSVGGGWELWDEDFQQYVPLTTAKQLTSSCGFVRGAVQIKVPPVSQQRSLERDGDTLMLARDSTMVGMGLVRLPTFSPQLVIQGATVGDSSNAKRVRIFLVRHGESEANVNPAVYKTVPDHAIALTEKGHTMAKAAGAYLKKYLEEEYGSKRNVDHHIRMLVSPYERTRQTAQGMLTMLNDQRVVVDDRWVDSVKEMAFLAEQDFGHCEGEGLVAKSKYSEELERINLQRKHRGKFWSRFPHGESPFDVAVRMSGVVSEIVAGCTSATSSRKRIQTFVLVSHGITIRAFLAAWCGKSPEWVAESANPPNCSIQQVDDVRHTGYIYGGFEKGELVAAHDIELSSDPRQDAWTQFL